MSQINTRNMLLKEAIFMSPHRSSHLSVHWLEKRNEYGIVFVFVAFCCIVSLLLAKSWTSKFWEGKYVQFVLLLEGLNRRCRVDIILCCVQVLSSTTNGHRDPYHVLISLSLSEHGQYLLKTRIGASLPQTVVDRWGIDVCMCGKEQHWLNLIQSIGTELMIWCLIMLFVLVNCKWLYPIL